MFDNIFTAQHWCHFKPLLLQRKWFSQQMFPIIAAFSACVWRCWWLWLSCSQKESFMSAVDMLLPLCWWFDYSHGSCWETQHLVDIDNCQFPYTAEIRTQKMRLSMKNLWEFEIHTECHVIFDFWHHPLFQGCRTHCPRNAAVPRPQTAALICP